MTISYDFFFFFTQIFVHAFYLQESVGFFPQVIFLEEKQTNKQQNKHTPPNCSWKHKHDVFLSSL